MSKSLQKFFSQKGNTYAGFGKALNPPRDKSTVKRWADGETLLPVSRLHEVSQLTGIPAHELRPDIFKAIEGAV